MIKNIKIAIWSIVILSTPIIFSLFLHWLGGHEFKRCSDLEHSFGIGLVFGILFMFIYWMIATHNRGLHHCEIECVHKFKSKKSYEYND